MEIIRAGRRQALKNLCIAGAAGLAGAPLWAASQNTELRAAVPNVLAKQRVTSERTIFAGRECLAVEMTATAQALELANQDGTGPNYVIVHRDFEDGVLEADLNAQLNGKGGADVRGFVGLAFHLTPDLKTYEAVYLRMTNGRLNNPPPPAPRIDRAIQYAAHPHFHYNASREKAPGRYERGADIALGRWHRLRLEIKGQTLRALVDGVEALRVDDLIYANRRGPVGLWADDGTRGFFSNLVIQPA